MWTPIVLLVWLLSFAQALPPQSRYAEVEPFEDLEARAGCFGITLPWPQYRINANGRVEFTQIIGTWERLTRTVGNMQITVSSQPDSDRVQFRIINRSGRANRLIVSQWDG
jgi:hypothetical protein